MKTTRFAMPLMRLLLALLVPLVVLALAGRPVAGREAGRGEMRIDPQADQLLHQMSDYLKGLKSFKVQAHLAEEEVLPSGQKIDVMRDTEASVLRPNRLQSSQMGHDVNLGFYYDGSTMTLHCRTNNTYATAPAPNDLDAAIDAARKKIHIEAPGGKLVSSDPYGVLTKGVTSGRYIGKESLNGVAAHHLAFQGRDADWQIWIQDGPQPLPLRYKITSKTMKSQPDVTVMLANWQPHANLTEADFTFQPPVGAKKLDEFPTECGGAAAKQ
jgi:hypothetical protein